MYVWLITFAERYVGIKGEIPVTRHIGSDIAMHIDVLPHYYVDDEA